MNTTPSTVNNQPISARAAAPALKNAGLVVGYRQALEQCANKLRGQAQAWIEEARAKVDAARSPGAYVRARLVLAETERWRARLERVADAIVHEQQARASEEGNASRMAETLIAALDAELERGKEQGRPRALLARLFGP